MPAPASRDELAKPARHEPVARPVESPAPHEVLLDPVGRHRVERVAVGNRGMEAGLEGGDERHARHPLAEQPHGPDVRRVVGRGHRRHLLHRREHVGPDPHDAAHAAAVHRLEPHRRHVARRSAAGRPSAVICSKRRLEGDGMVRNGLTRLDRTPADGRMDAALRGPDPFHAAARKLPLPPASAARSGRSKSRYLKLVEPRLATRMFMVMRNGRRRARMDHHWPCGQRLRRERPPRGCRPAAG